MTLNIQHLAVLRFIPALCIEVGYYLRHGGWLTDLSYETVFREFHLVFLNGFLAFRPLLDVSAMALLCI